MNLNSQLQLSRLQKAKQNRYNPLPGITNPTQITRKLDAFEIGYLKDAVNIWDSLEQRDDLIRTVVSKRKKSIGRQGWTVQIRDSVTPAQRAEAEQHAAALEYFYQNLRCENALDRAERGGFKLLCRQMMDAIGKRFAVHEIVWKVGGAGSPSLPSFNNFSLRNAPDLKCQMKNAHLDSRSGRQDLGTKIEAGLGTPCSMLNESSPSAFSPQPSAFPQLTAAFRFVPLSFFENTTGDLRYLESESAVSGTPLQPGAWMITTGEGLMMATATAWILKNLTLNDWLLYSERNGRPGLRGITSATPNSDEWKALDSALHDIINGSTVVHSTTDDVKVIDLAAGNHIPFPELVDRIDRMIAALWRGADLSTISRDRGYGASLQEKETCALEEDDAEILTETLNEYVDQWVIRYLFGDDVQPLANVKVLVTPEECTTADLQIDDFLYRTGAPLSLTETLNRYGRSLPKPDEPILQLTSSSHPYSGRALSPTVPGGAGSPSLPSSMKNETCSMLNAQSNSSSSLPSFPYVRKSHNFSVRPSGFRLSLSPRESSQHAAAHANTVRDVHDCASPVNSRDSSIINTGIDPGAPTTTGAPDVSTPSTHANNPQIHSSSNLPHSSEPSVVQNSSPSFSSLPSVENSGSFSPQPSAFSLLQNDWLQLSPYGDFPHPRGLQRVDREAADTMVKRFNSFRGRLGRLFGGAPFYIGHPDLPHTSELADKKAYGWVMQLEAREDGIYGRVKWSEAGLDILKNAHFKYLSPYWDAEQIASNNGHPIFRPTNLRSVGLTNTPNIPVKPLANCEAVAAPRESAPLSNDPILIEASNHCHETLTEEPLATAAPKPLVNTGIHPGDSDTPARSSVSTLSKEQSQFPPLPPVNEPEPLREAPDIKCQMKNAHLDSRSGRQDLGTKIEAGLGTPCSRLNEKTSSSNHYLTASRRALSPLLANLHTTSLTQSIASRRCERLHFQTRREHLHNAVKSKMRLGLTYDQAWDNIRKESPALFTND